MTRRRRRATPGGVAAASLLLLVVAVPVTFVGTVSRLGDGGPERESGGDPVLPFVLSSAGQIGILVALVGFGVAAFMAWEAASARKPRLRALRPR